MVSFESDYIAGAHPEVLKRLCDTNMESLSGYGADFYTDSAKKKIASALGDPDAQIIFLTGGTQTNAVVISSMLHDWEGVVAASTGHISVHEAGAIEHSGHKVLALEHCNGKISASSLERMMEDFHNDGNHEHMVFPGMAYISHPTEYGSLYSKKELSEIYSVCVKYSIPLFIDGARLAYALMSRKTDVTLRDIYELSDVFYIGGTKAGALCGEAVVFSKHNMPKHFITSVKKRGALLAKGRLLGVQFDALFTDDLYLRIGAHGIDMAERMKSIFHKYGLRFAFESPTNQQFIILENSLMERLSEKIGISFWEKHDDFHTVLRLATSWSTSESDLEYLEKAISSIS